MNIMTKVAAGLIPNGHEILVGEPTGRLHGQVVKLNSTDQVTVRKHTVDGLDMVACLVFDEHGAPTLSVSAIGITFVRVPEEMRRATEPLSAAAIKERQMARGRSTY